MISTRQTKLLGIAIVKNLSNIDSILTIRKLNRSWRELRKHGVLTGIDKKII
nr:hypothetical protein GTC16762_18930 [Pigmentibacter ruber]